nr:origin of replication complex subunit 1A-like [Ipomoea batatas]
MTFSYVNMSMIYTGIVSSVRIADIDDGEEDCEEAESDREWNSAEASSSDSEDDVEYEEENNHNLLNRRQLPTHPLAANSQKGRIFGLQKIGAKKLPEHVRSHKLTELEKAKAKLLLETLPKSLPRRNKYVDI